MRTGTFTAAAIIASMSGTALGQAASWNNPSGGTWNTASNWMPSVVPNGTTFDVTLGLAVGYTVDMNINANLGSLSITNPLAVLSMRNSLTMNLEPGVLFNAGSIIVNEPGSIFDSRIVFNGPTTISGAGEIVLGAASEIGSVLDARLETSGEFDVTIGSDQVIRGNGELRGLGTFVNLGTIRSEDPLGPGINIAMAVDQSGGGTVDVAGGIVTFSNNSALIGSDITGSGSGVVRVLGLPAIMNDVTLNAPLQVLGNNNALSLLGPLVNNNSITLNPDGLIFNSVLRFDADTSISGTGSIVMIATGQQNDAQIVASPGFTGTIGSGQSVSGQGQISGTIVLDGTMTATSAGSNDLAVLDSISGSGTLFAADDAILALDSASVTGLTFDTSPSGLVAARNGETFVDDVHNLGNAGVAGNNTRLSLTGDIVNDGLITLNYTNTIFNAVLDFKADASILGTGQIRMNTSGNLNDAQIVTTDPAVATIGAGQEVAGSGLISGVFVNNGVFDGDDPTASLQISGNVSGPGQFRSTGGELSFSNLDLSGHTLSTASGGLITAAVGASTLTDVTNTGDLGINGNNTRLSIDGAFTNDGDIFVNINDLIFDAVLGVNTASVIGGVGTIDLEIAGNLNDARIEAENGLTATFGPGQTITGSGSIRGDVVVQGSINPSGDAREFNAQAGTLATIGNSVFDLGGLAAAEFDRITTSSGEIIELGGSIDVNLDDGYSPMFGDQWTIIGGAANTVVNGSYDSYQLPPAPLSLAYRVFIEPNRVFVRLTCAADFNGDATLNFFDISNYIMLFNAGDPRADLAAPFGSLNFFDIVTYISIYNSGCN